MKSLVKQAALWSQERLMTEEDLGLDKAATDATPVTLQQARDAAERQAISMALQRNKHNMTHAARELRISRMTLYRLTQKHNINNTV